MQTTLHFNKRIEKIISYLNKSNLVEHEGIQYTLSSYFYRIEFQVFNSLLYITMGVFNFNYQIKVCKRNSFYFLTNIIDKVELELSFQLELKLRPVLVVLGYTHHHHHPPLLAYQGY